MASSVKPPPNEFGAAEAVRSTWERVLGCPVEWGDDFFDLGGDSLTALSVAADIAQATGLVVPAGWLYRHPRIADAVRALLRSPAADISAPIPLPRQGRHPLSSQQDGLLAVMRHIGGEHRYQVAYAVALDARMDAGRLRAAWQRMPDRHPALATRLVPCGDTFVQDVHAALSPPLEHVVVSSGASVGKVTDRWACADIALDGPLARAGLIQGAGEIRFVLAAHQMVMDPWSWGLLLRDLAVLYADPDAGGAPRLAYSDYARWQHTHLTGQNYARHLRFWQEAADGSPAGGARLPGAPGVIAPAGPAARLPLQVPGELVAVLDERSRSLGASLFEALLALFQLAVGRWAGTDDVLVASATASRTVPTEDVAGFFVNGRFTRTRIIAGTAADLVDQVKHSWRAAEEHRELHLEKTLFDLGRPDMANVKFSLNTIPGLTHLPDLGGRRMRAVPVTGAASARRHVSVGLTRVEDGLAGALTYRTDLLTQDTVADLMADLDQLLRAFAADPDQPLSLARR
ncbi:condensation domain-containing protein [Streptomyces decoyicus]|uniref:condensation domain-containing protein n=1 Tax=Streptomyces decoyicus TaxID=249567 RepID=UPI0036591630